MVTRRRDSFVGLAAIYENSLFMLDIWLKCVSHKLIFVNIFFCLTYKHNPVAVSDISGELAEVPKLKNRCFLIRRKN